MQLRFRRALCALLALLLLASSPALALGFIFGGETDAPAASAIWGIICASRRFAVSSISRRCGYSFSVISSWL